MSEKRIVNLASTTATSFFGFKGETKVKSGAFRQLMLTSALALLAYHGAVGVVSAEVLRQSGDIDGNNSSGFIVTLDERFGSSAGNVFIGNLDTQSRVHNFATVGGAGSGGGAGLGGAFFVDSDAVLTVTNTDFKSNRVEGGQGGSTPPIAFFDQNLNISGRRADVLAVLGTSSTPAQFERTEDGYTISSLVVGSEALTLLQSGAELNFDKLSATSVASTIVEREGLVRFEAPLTVAESKVATVSAAEVGSGTNTNPDQGGFTFLDSRTIKFLRNTPEGEERPTDIEGLSDLTVGSVIFVGNEAVTVKSFGFNDQGLLDTVTLSEPVSTAQNTIDILPPLGFSAANFTRPASDKVTVLDDSKTFQPGMTVSWEEDGESRTARINEVNGSTLTLDRDLPADVYGFTAVKNPVVDANTIEVPDAASLFAVGDTVYLPDDSGEIAYAGSVASVENNRVVFTPASGNSSSLQDLYVDGVGLAVRRPAAVVDTAANTITVDVVPNEIVTSGMTISGAGFAEGTTINSVSQVGGKWVIELSQAVEDVGAIGFFRIASPLVKGGSMNGLQSFANSEGADGADGSSITYSPSALSDGEGIDGNNGQSASDPDVGTGFDGGNGGNGSAGMNVNPGLIYDLTSATYGFTAAINGVVQAGLDLSGAISPDILITVTGGVTAPDPVEIAAKTAGLGFSIADLVFATADLGIVIADQALWNRALADGFVGRGGAGGDGGEGSGGADFFGGGAGGNGGNGGDGGADTTHGGDAGDGGRGGDGGFGAGGGQGGAGGSGGAHGFAYDGDPGDGGFGGFGAGDGTNGNGMFGGGGSGLGGAIFVRDGGSLIIQGNSIFELNYVAGGSTSSLGGEAGMSAGTDLFMMKGSSVRLEPGLGNEIRFEGDIADDSLATNDGFMNAAGDGADITIAGAGGLVVFNGENTYSGDTILEGATLTALVGEGVNDSSTLRFNGRGLGGSALADAGGTLSLGTTGTFLLQEDYVRRAGTDPHETMWTGSGGFASSVEEGLIVNLGELDSGQKVGQGLVWGRDGFFVSEGTGAGIHGTLTFGSEHSVGSIEFTNNVDLDGNEARIAVYGGAGNHGNGAAHFATVSGDWTGGTLRFGDGSSGTLYDGLLAMSGQNSLSEVIAQGGHLTTYNSEVDGEHGTILSAGGNLFVYPRASVSLFGTEIARSASVLADGSLYFGGNTTLSGSLESTGLVIVHDGARDEIVGFPELPNVPDMFSAVGSLTVEGDITNGARKVVDGVTYSTGRLLQAGTISVGGNITNNGAWSGNDALSVTGSVVNYGLFSTNEVRVAGLLTNNGRLANGTLVKSDTGVINDDYWSTSGGVLSTPSLTGSGTFCLQALGFNADECREQTADVAAMGLGATLTLDLADNSTFDGTFAGAGSLTKDGSGVLTLTADQHFEGILAIETGGVVANATMNDNLDLVVYDGATYVANIEDTVATVHNAGTMTLNAALNTTGSFENLSANTLHMNADLSTEIGGLANSGRIVVTGDRLIRLGTHELLDAGLSGTAAGVIEIKDGSSLTIDQDGDSVYSGEINAIADGTSANNAALVKSGVGAITLQGVVSVLDITIAEGALRLDGANLLNPSAAVDISSAGVLTLVSGDQSIEKLTGSGLVELGVNRLRIEDGGLFNGTINGQGTVDVRNGDFTVNGDLNSTDAVFQVQAASTTTVAASSELNVGDLEVYGTLALSADGNGNMARVSAETAIIVGSLGANGIIPSTLKGTGMVAAPTIVGMGGRLSPGASPGHLYFDELTLSSGSTSTIELYSGVIDDKITVNPNGKLNIEGSSLLSLTSNYKLPLGEVTRVFNFDVGAINGMFGGVTASGEIDAENLLFNLATGSVVGLGDRTIDELKDVAATTNQEALLGGMIVNQEGGVTQFYGGAFVENLVGTWSRNGDMEATFERASPEVYAGLSAMAQSAALNATPDWYHSIAADSSAEGTFVEIGSTNFSASDYGNTRMAFGVNTTNATVGFIRPVTDNTSFVFNLGHASTKLNGDYTSADADGVTTGIGLVGQISQSDVLFWNTGFQFANLRAQGVRFANNGSVLFDDVDAYGRQFNVGMEYFQAWDTRSFGLRGNVVVGNGKTKTFAEEPAGTNPLDAMSVDGISSDYARFEVGMQAGVDVVEGTRLFGSLDASMPINETNTVVGASYDNGQADFAVSSRGLDASSITASIGVDRAISETGTLSISFGANNDWQSDTTVTANISARINF